MPAVASKNKHVEQMAKVMSTQSLSYNYEGKQAFKKASVPALRQIAKDLGLIDAKASLNEGGIAVSGDASLMGMWADGKGINLHINQFMGNEVRYRTIQHMKDFHGGPNNFMKVENMAADYAAAIESFLRLKSE